MTIDDIKRRLEAATPGPWREHYEYRDGRPDGTMIGAVAPGHRILTDHDGGTYPSSDLTFIVHAPEDIAYLLQRIEEMQAAIKAFCRASEWCEDTWKKQPHIAALFAIAEAKE
jgi:hypothetical protein